MGSRGPPPSCSSQGRALGLPCLTFNYDRSGTYLTQVGHETAHRIDYGYWTTEPPDRRRCKPRLGAEVAGSGGIPASLAVSALLVGAAPAPPPSPSVAPDPASAAAHRGQGSWRPARAGTGGAFRAPRHMAACGWRPWQSALTASAVPRAACSTGRPVRLGPGGAALPSAGALDGAAATRGAARAAGPWHWRCQGVLSAEALDRARENGRPGVRRGPAPSPPRCRHLAWRALQPKQYRRTRVGVPPWT